MAEYEARGEYTGGGSGGGRRGRGGEYGGYERREYSPGPPPPVRDDRSSRLGRRWSPRDRGEGRERGEYYDDYRYDSYRGGGGGGGRYEGRRRSVSPYGRDYDRDYDRDYRGGGRDYYGGGGDRGGNWRGGRRDEYYRPRDRQSFERKRGPSERPTEEEKERSTTIWIGNLPYDYKDQDVVELFEKFGEIEKVTVPIDRHTTKNKGFAFVQFFKREDAVEAFEHFKGATLDGRRVRIDWDVKKEPETGPVDLPPPDGDHLPPAPPAGGSGSQSADDLHDRPPRD